MRVLIVATTALTLGCGKQSNPSPGKATTSETATETRSSEFRLPKPWTDDVLLGQTERYLTNAPLRRAVLEASLTNPENIYALTRLSGYGLEGQGWEMLPEWVPVAAPIVDSDVATLRAGGSLALPDSAKPIWDGVRPTDMTGWVALGRRVFYEYPLRSEVFAEHALRSEALSERIGLSSNANGEWPGVVNFRTLEGPSEIGITCALCHVAMESGQAIEGRARRNLDYGEMRVAYYRDTGAPLEDRIRRRMESWGPGRADITQDDDEDPVAIVDLWGARGHEYLTQSGTIHQVHPIALAIRQETQLLHANHERIRPPRELAWALAMYVYSLTPPPVGAHLASAPKAVRGGELFSEHCSHCHRDENYGGLPVSAASIGTDPLLANGTARGTGLYRPAPLTRVRDAAPYLHDGTVPTLEGILDPNRSVQGHRYGTQLPKADREALVAFMNTL